MTELDALCARYGLGPPVRDALSGLVELVVADPLAPTTVRDRLGVVREHLADSLIALDLEPIRSARAITDLGSGAGFPGLPLAIALPSAVVWLVESNRRKCEFLDRAVAVAAADNALVVNDRAETWAAGRGACDLVVARALAPLAVVAEYAAPLLGIDGRLVAWRGRRDADDEAAASRAAVELGLEYGEPLAVQPFPGALHRHLHVLVKRAETPSRFPRRPGIARKRPLGAERRG
ncbi:MAG: 16S rRNA (guanine(527)-N(7))-methyltransferase RsmG [Solirubrobacteraceae bacterium]|jgi:16S rRNA (guanine527-N7)-methyltransferase